MNFKLIFISLATLILLFGCNGGIEPETAPVQIQSQVIILQTENYQWVANFSLIDFDNVKYSAEAILVIHNKVDRNVTIDFDGPIHKTVSLGDNTKKIINLQPGTYKIMASSPGLPYVPNDYGQTLNAYSKYSLVFFKKKLKTNYNK